MPVSPLAGPATPLNDFKESRMKFVDLTKPYRKSGGMGHPGFCCSSREGLTIHSPP
jgi:hypothetical protein